MKFYYAGQISMANRGCEALIRSNTQLIRERFPDAQLFCPSEDAGRDRRQWPQAARFGVEFVPLPKFPLALKAWGKVIGKLPWARGLGVMPVELDTDTKRLMRSSDGILMTGGDVISLEYGLNALYFWAGLMDAAHRLGKPTHLLAASVGPFTPDPILERQMVGHLNRYTTISVRESASHEYLHSLGVDAMLVTDPAFVMTPQPFEVGEFMQSSADYLGLNVSPLVRKFRGDEASKVSFDNGLVAFIRRVVTETGLHVLFVPHVDPLDQGTTNSDRAYMMGLRDRLGDLGPQVTITPDLLNAAQIKYVLSKCRYFIGARTHATIGAMSQGVPTCSIAYSVKAVGINKDLFGTTKYVLPTPEVNQDTLMKSLDLLIEEEESIKSLLATRIPIWRQRAGDGLRVLEGL